MQAEPVKKIGRMIKGARKQQGLTQAQLAAIVGVGIRFIRELECGKESCHLGKTLNVLSMLGIDLKLNDEIL